MQLWARSLVKVNSSNFDKFVAILKKKPQTFNTILNLLSRDGSPPSPGQEEEVEGEQGCSQYEAEEALSCHCLFTVDNIFPAFWESFNKLGTALISSSSVSERM